MNGAQADADRLPERREGGKKTQIHRLERESPGNNQGRNEKLQEIFFFFPFSSPSHVKHCLYSDICELEVGGRSQFVMLKYERTEPGRVKAHGRGLSVYSGL